MELFQLLGIIPLMKFSTIE